MTELSEENQRISMQVSALSTQLIESIDKQSQLEENLRHANGFIQSQKSISDNFESLKTEHETLKKDFTQKSDDFKQLQEKLTSERVLREQAEIEVTKLSQEVEDLTATLFSEANNMVADARRETHTTEVLNTKLVEQLKDKDNLLETLTLQLKDLKKVMQNIETESIANQNNRHSTILNDSDTLSSKSLNRVNTANSITQRDPTISIIYSPYTTTIRYDLTLFSEFLKFIAVLPYCKSIRDTASESKLLRRLVNDEIQPILKIDNAAGIRWLAKKSVMQQMIDGLVILEPLSGINETFQFGYRNANTPSTAITEEGNDNHLYNYPSNSPPVAVHGPCSLCSEDRDDILEHARMHVLKTQNKAEDGTLTVTNTYPLCFNCVNKVRQTCEIFAFLRSLKLGTWNLEKVTLKNIAKGDSTKFTAVTPTVANPSASPDKKSKRMSFMGGLSKSSQSRSTPQFETANAVVERAGQPTTNIQRAWIQLCKLRCMLFWAHIGIWSLDDSVAGKIGPIIRSKDDELEGSTPDDMADWHRSSTTPSLSSSKPETPDVKDEFDFESKSDLNKDIENPSTKPIEGEQDVTKDETFTESTKDETFTKEKEDKSTALPENSSILPSEEDEQVANKIIGDNEEEMDDTKGEMKEDDDKEAKAATENDKNDEDEGDGDDSLDILNDYSENPNSKVDSVSDDEDTFDDAKESLE